MTTLNDVFGEGFTNGDLGNAIVGGLVTERVHPEFPELRILNYTPKAAYEGVWNDVTLNCRGLIYNANTLKVLARPFRKFFNYGQAEAPAIASGAKLYHVANKFDGSLGIGYIRPDGQFAIATRGSFDSLQARHATETVWDQPERYQWYRGDVSVGYTPLFEIIYPENRIVLDYGAQDYLQFLGWVNIETGKFTPPGSEADPWATTMRAVLEREPRKNAEGWVVWLDQHTAVKIKQDDYVALHKIVTGLSEKVVWQRIQEGPTLYAEFVASLPDELQGWASGVGFDLALRFGEIVRELDGMYLTILDSDEHWLTQGFDRGLFARKVKEFVRPEYQGFMFAMLDGKDISEKVWKLLEPKGVSARPTAALVEEEA